MSTLTEWLNEEETKELREDELRLKIRNTINEIILKGLETGDVPDRTFCKDIEGFNPATARAVLEGIREHKRLILDYQRIIETEGQSGVLSRYSE